MYKNLFTTPNVLAIKLFFFYSTISFLGLCYFLVSTPAVAQNTGGIGGKPAYPRQDNPRTQTIFVHTATTGQEIKEGIKVINTSNEKKSVLVYATDSEVSSGGAFACKQQVEPKNDVGSWIKLEQTEVTVDALSSITVPFTINIPDNASIGEHNGCVLLQEKKEAPNQPGVNLTFRSGIRVALLIPGEITRKLSIAGFEVTQKGDGTRILRPQIKNEGNVSIDTNVNTVTQYFFGTTYKQTGGQYPVLRGETSEWNFELEKPYWGGFYKSYVVAEYDQSKEAGIGVNSGKDLVKLQSSPTWFFSFPSTTALIIELLVLVLTIGLIYILTKQLTNKLKVRKNWIDYIVIQGDTINTVADKFDTNWKNLAAANRLKPPYVLATGQIIKVPPRQ